MKQFHFSYARWYLLTHPWKLVKEICDNIKWALQRVFRGWDDRVVWSIDYHLCQVLPEWLTKLKEDKIGVPGVLCGDSKTIEESEAEWDAELDKMIAGFEAGYVIAEGIYGISTKKVEEIENVFDIGIESFHEYFFSLWD